MKIRNDSSMSDETALAYLESHDPVEIRYGELMMKTERGALDQARQHVATMDIAERQGIMISVDRALRRNAPKIMRGKFSKKIADNFFGDLVLWTALKEGAAQ